MRGSSGYIESSGHNSATETLTSENRTDDRRRRTSAGQTAVRPPPPRGCTGGARGCSTAPSWPGVLLIGLPDLSSGHTDGPFGETITGTDLPTALVVLLLIGLVLPLWWRRRFPTVTFAVVAAVLLVVWSLGVWLDSGAGLLVALYSLARYGPLRALGWAAAAAVLEVTAAAFFLLPVSHPVPGVFMLLGTTTAAVALGLAVRTRRG
jgi:hypothetical protein